MAKIIIFGDIDISQLYISVDGSKEMVVSGEWPRYINLNAGTHYITATTATKIERISNSDNSTFMNVTTNMLVNAVNSAVAGNVYFDQNDALLIQVKQHLAKPVINQKMVDISQVSKYVDTDALLEVGERAPGEKNKWVVLLLCLFLGFLGVHRFYEKKIGTGILYLLTFGLFGCGVLYDLYRIFIRES